MKRIGIVACVGLTACAVRIEPLYQPYPPYLLPRRHVIHHRQKPANHKTEIVDSNWMQNYRRLEHEHGDFDIPQDDQIKAIDGRFRVPMEVILHNQDMTLAKPTP